MITSLYLCVNPDKPDSARITEEISRVGAEHDITLVDAPSAADAVISIGGDGTFLYACHLAAEYSIPVAGVNLGRYGFLPTYTPAEIGVLLESLQSGPSNWSTKSMIQATCDGVKTFVVNEVVVERKRVDRAIRLEVALNDGSGDELDYTTFVCDGVIVATPMGSTAYSASVGGPVVTHESNVMSLAFAALHHPRIDPVIVDKTYTVSIRVQDDAVLSCDGKCIMELEAGSIIDVAISSETFSVCEKKRSLIPRLVKALSS